MHSYKCRIFIMWIPIFRNTIFILKCDSDITLRWRHNEHDGVSNHRFDYLLSRLVSPDQRKHQSSASLTFVRVIHRWLVNSQHKGPVTRKSFPFDDVIMICVLLPDCHLPHSADIEIELLRCEKQRPHIRQLATELVGERIKTVVVNDGWCYTY